MPIIVDSPADSAAWSGVPRCQFVRRSDPAGVTLQRMTRGLITALAALLLMAGCGESASGDTKVDDSKNTASSSPTTDETPLTTATVQQYASIVARNSDLRGQLRDMSDCNWFGMGRLDRPGYLVCSVGMLTMSYLTGTLASSLTVAAESGSAEYIGAPPQEIESLVDETATTARTLSTAAAKADKKGCGETGRGQCMGLRIDVWQAQNDLKQALQAWGPYL